MAGAGVIAAGKLCSAPAAARLGPGQRGDERRALDRAAGCWLARAARLEIVPSWCREIASIGSRAGDHLGAALLAELRRAWTMARTWRSRSRRRHPLRADFKQVSFGTGGPRPTQGGGEGSCVAAGRSRARSRKRR